MPFAPRFNYDLLRLECIHLDHGQFLIQKPTGFPTIEQDSAVSPGQEELILGDLRNWV